MSTPASPSGGRRANGLPAADWGALVDLDPRLSEALLDRLADAGVPAYVEPAGGTADALVRAVSHPSRPLDRLWVDPDRADVARAVVTAEVSDLTSLLAEDDPSATAHGFVQPVPRTAAPRVLSPPSLPGPVGRALPSGDGAPADGAFADPAPGAPGTGAGPADGQPDTDEVFRQIIAGFERDGDHVVPPWPVAEDVEDSGRGGPAGRSPTPEGGDAGPPARRLRRRTDEPEDAALPAWVEPEPVEDDGHFVPPPPPPAPRVSGRTLAAVAAALLGAVLMFAPQLVGQYAGFGVGLLGVGLFVGGVGALIWAMRDAPPNDSGPDDGAVV